MAYPTVARRAPDFPALETEVLDYWARRRHVPGPVDAGPQARRRNEYVFYDGPPFANGLPHYGHLLTGYVKDIVPRYQHHARLPGGAPLRLGHPRPARRDSRPSASSGITDKSADRRDGHRGVQRRLPRVGAALHRRVARLRHPPGPLGRLRQRLQDARPGLHGVGHLGVQDSCGTRAWSTRASACCRTAGTTRPRCPTTRLRMDDDVYQSRQDPAVTVGLRLSAPRHRSRWRRSHWSGRRRRGRCRPTWRWRSTRTSTTSLVEAERRALRPGRRPRLPAYARELGDEPERAAAPSAAPSCSALRYLPPFDFFVGRANAHHVLAADFVTTEDGTGIVHMAPAYGEDDKVVTDAAGIEVGHAGRLRGPLRRHRAGLRGQHVFDANPQIIRDLKEPAGRAC